MSKAQNTEGGLVPRRSNTPKALRRSRGRDRRLSIRGERRKQLDLDAIAETVVLIAIAQAEKEAQEQAEEQRRETSR